MIEFCVFCCLHLHIVRNLGIFLKNIFFRLQFLIFSLTWLSTSSWRQRLLSQKKNKILQGIMGKPSGDGHNVGCALNPWGILVLRVWVSMLDTAILNAFQTNLQDVLHGDVEDRWFPQEKTNRCFALWLPIAVGFQTAKQRFLFLASKRSEQNYFPAFKVFKNRQKFYFFEIVFSF